MTSLSGFEHLSGDEWQDLCVRVLHEHHPGAELVEVPDDDRGDAGLEAFALNGCAYQCYAPEGEPLSISARYRKQRDKMTTDVGKFIKNADKIKKLLPAELLINRWALLVPHINSQSLLEHAKKKTDEVRAASLCYASPDIVVVPLTLSAFEGAREAVVNRQLRKFDVPPVDFIDYSDIDDELIGQMTSKLAMTTIYADDGKRSKITDRFMKNYIAGRTHRDFVQDQYSEPGYQLEERLNDLEDRLSVQYALNEPAPDRRLIRVLTDTEETVDSLLNTRMAQSRVIAEGQVADWLMLSVGLPMTGPTSETTNAVREDRSLWALVAASDDASSMPSDLDVVFRRQPKPVDARHRVAYRTALLVLVLARFNKHAAKLSSLHILMWATRSARTRRMFTAWWDGRRSYNTLTERIDPDLEITLNLALIDGVVAPVGRSARVQLTAKGAELADLIAAETELLTVEKSFLDSFARLSDTSLEKKLGVVPQ